LRRLFNPHLPRPFLPLKLAAPGAAGLVVATLPRWARRMYGLPATPLEDLWATTALKALHLGTQVIPEPWRYSPHPRRARRRTRGAGPDLPRAPCLPPPPGGRSMRWARACQAGGAGMFHAAITGLSCSVPRMLIVPVSRRNNRPSAGGRPK